MSAQLFQRDYKVTVDTLQVRALDMTFKVVRDLKPKTPNTAEINLYNLTDAHRREMEQRKTVRVHLEAGYQAPKGAPVGSAFSTTSLIFAGDLRQVGTTKEGPDSITKISTGDGEKKHQQARTKRSYAPGVAIKKVIQDLAADAGYGPGNLSSLGAVEFPKVGAVLNGGASFSGSAVDELDGMLRSAGYEWSVQNGNLQILPRGLALRAEAILLTPETGLIGSPSMTSDGVMHATCLMIPDVFPGRLVQIKAAGVSGFFRLSRCEYTGDFAGKDWQIDLEGHVSVGTVAARAAA